MPRACVIKYMTKIVFATRNAHKLAELQAIAGSELEIVSLDTLGCTEDIPEDGLTLHENAVAKARWVSQRYGLPCFADDTGLEVDALNGAPGVYSARYSGEAHNDAANRQLLLHNMEGVPVEKRTARFRTVIAYLESPDAEPRTFEGAVEGRITRTEHGNGGFGYDPVFRPEGWAETFAEAAPERKNAVSHRARATAAFMAWLLK